MRNETQMPPLPVADHVLKYEVLGTYGATRWANIFHMNYVGASDPTDLQALLVQLDTFYDTEFMPLQMNTSSHNNSVLTDLSTDTSPRAETSPAHVGSSTAPAGMPANVSVGVSWPILRRYRGGHPRTYLPAPAQNILQSPSTLDPGAITDFQTAAAAFQTDVNAAVSGTITQVNLGSLSYRSGNAIRVTPLFEKFSGVPVVHPRIDTQRRRLGKETL